MCDSPRLSLSHCISVLRVYVPGVVACDQYMCACIYLCVCIYVYDECMQCIAAILHVVGMCVSIHVVGMCVIIHVVGMCVIIHVVGMCVCNAQLLSYM